MHHSVGNSLGQPLFQSKSVVLEDCAICVDAAPVRPHHEYVRWDKFNHLPEFLFALSKLFFATAQILIYVSKLSGSVIEDSSKVRELVFSLNGNLVPKLTSCQGSRSLHQVVQRQGNTVGDYKAEDRGNQ